MKFAFLVLCLLLLAFHSQARAQEVINKLNEKISIAIAHSTHPSIKKFTPIIKRLYEELNFDVRFIPAPNLRALSLLQQGAVFGDVARIKDAIENIPEVMLIEPALAVGQILVLCNKDKICEIDQLNRSNITLLSANGLIEIGKKSLPNANIFKHDLTKNQLTLLRKRRVDYILYIDTKQKALEYKQEFNVLLLKDAPVHHVINKKHSKFAPLISAKLKELLANSKSNN
mgnify:CR=1 FL=1